MRRDVTRFDPVLVLGIACAAGPPLVLAPLVTAATLVVGLVLAWGALPRAWPPFLLALAVLAGVRAESALERADLEHRAVAERLSPPQRCELRGRIARSPIVVGGAAGPSALALGRARFDVDVLGGVCEHGPAPLTRVRLYEGPEDAARGDVFDLVVDLAAVQRFDNPGLTDPRLALASSLVTASGRIVDASRGQGGVGVRAAIDHFRSHVRRRIESSLPADVAPLSRALVLGETDLDEGDRAAFQGSGLAHLLAVSGTHLVIAVMAFVRLLGAALVRINWLARRGDARCLAAALGVPLAVAYADFAGGSGSAWRAAVMLGCALVTRALGEKPNGTRCLAFALLGPVLIEPLATADASFLLSLAATSALMAMPRGASSDRTQFIVHHVGEAIRTTVAATLATAPILLLLGAALPIHGVAANLLAAPIGELIALPASLLHAGLWWAPPLEGALATIAAGALRTVQAIAHAAADSPGATWALPPPTAVELAVCALSVLAVACWKSRRWLVGGAAIAALVAAEIVAHREGAPTGGLRITALDVGQGDSLLVEFPDGRAMLVDGGGMVGSGIDLGRRVLLPELAARRRRRIDIVVVTHPHPDHFLGFLTALPELEVGEVWESGLASATDPDGALARLLRTLGDRGAVLRRPAELCRGTHSFGGAEVRVLAPCPGFDGLASANDNSIVLQLRLGSRSALLVGDAERETEARLVATYGTSLKADLLKVGHHGSRTSSTPAFLAAVAPEVAIISSGVRNRFGHPARVTLDALASRSIDVRRTDRKGAIVFWTDGKTFGLTNIVDARRARALISSYDASTDLLP